MALRLSSDLRKNSKSSTGFDIKFTEGLTYNLDELIANKNRKDSTIGLVIEVKKSKEIAKLAMDELKRDIIHQLNSTLEQDDIRLKLSEVITEVFSKYNCSADNIPENAYSEINYLMNTYLSEVYNNHGLNYTITIVDGENILITADFKGNSDLSTSFAAYYDKFRKLYDSNMTVSEGGLAISDEKTKIRVNKLDYTKYLLDEKSQTVQSGSQSTPSYTRAPVVVWEDGTIDERPVNPTRTVYDEISDLEDRISLLEKMLNEK